MLAKRTFLQQLLVPTQARAMSTASIHARFEAAYQERRSQQSRGTRKQ